MDPTLALKGVLININRDNTPASATVPNIDTNIKTFSLQDNKYAYIQIDADIEVSTVILSTIQAISILAKIGSQNQTYTVRPVAIVGMQHLHISFSAIQMTAATLAVSHGSILADANTTITVKNLFVTGMV